MALADKTRLRLLNLIRQDEICVCFFTEVLNESQPKISRHLAYLRSAGIVEARREGKWMHYRIIEPENDYAAQVLQDILEWLKSHEEMQRDYENLAIACCSPSAPITISRAPKPSTFVEANISFIQSEPSVNVIQKEQQRAELETFLL